MLIHVDIGQLHSHIALLYREEREAQALVDCITKWLNQASLEANADIPFIQKHLHIVRNQVGNIRRRIVLLEKAIDCFSHEKRTSNQTLSDIKDLLSIPR